MQALINKLEKANRNLKRLESYIKKSSNEKLQDKHFQLWKERKLILKHIAMELS